MYYLVASGIMHYIYADMGWKITGFVISRYYRLSGLIG